MSSSGRSTGQHRTLFAHGQLIPLVSYIVLMLTFCFSFCRLWVHVVGTDCDLIEVCPPPSLCPYSVPYPSLSQSPTPLSLTLPLSPILCLAVGRAVAGEAGGRHAGASDRGGPQCAHLLELPRLHAVERGRRDVLRVPDRPPRPAQEEGRAAGRGQGRQGHQVYGGGRGAAVWRHVRTLGHGQGRGGGRRGGTFGKMCQLRHDRPC